MHSATLLVKFISSAHDFLMQICWSQQLLNWFLSNVLHCILLVLNLFPRALSHGASRSNSTVQCSRLKLATVIAVGAAVRIVRPEPLARYRPLAHDNLSFFRSLPSFFCTSDSRIAVSLTTAAAAV